MNTRKLEDSNIKTVSLTMQYFFFVKEYTVVTSVEQNLWDFTCAISLFLEIYETVYPVYLLLCNCILGLLFLETREKGKRIFNL